MYLLDQGEWVSIIEIPKSGDKTYTIEVSISDPDGVSSAQAKIGRLALLVNPKHGYCWRMMVKMVTESREMVYFLCKLMFAQVYLREMNYLIRASDIFQSITPVESQTYTIELVDEKSSAGGGANWVSENSTTLVLIGLLMLLALGATAIVVTMRNADFE